MGTEKQDKSSRRFEADGKTHQLSPRDVKRAIDLPFDGDIDKWPAHAINRLYSGASLNSNSKRKITTLKDLINPAFDHSKPKFLIYLESFVKRELAYRNVPPCGVSVDRLQIYREVFDYVVEAFHSYGPILAAIKREYDTVIKFYVENIRVLTPMKSNLYLFSAECDRKILQVRENEKKDNTVLMDMNKELKNEIYDLQHENDELRHTIKRITLVTEEEHQKYRDERDAKMIVLLDKEGEADKHVKTNEEYYAYREEVENLKISLFEAKKAHSDAIQRLLKMESNYTTVVPKSDFVALLEVNEELQKEVKRLGTSLEEAEKEKKEANQLYGIAIEQRDNYYMKLMHAISGKIPDWIISADFLGSMMEKWNKADLKKTYNDVVENVMRDILINPDKDLPSDDESEETRYNKATEGLDSDRWRSARLLAEIIVDRIYDQNASKPSTLRKMSKMFDKFEKVLTPNDHRMSTFTPP